MGNIIFTKILRHLSLMKTKKVTSTSLKKDPLYIKKNLTEEGRKYLLFITILLKAQGTSLHISFIILDYRLSSSNSHKTWSIHQNSKTSGKQTTYTFSLLFELLFLSAAILQIGYIRLIFIVNYVLMTITYTIHMQRILINHSKRVLYPGMP